MKSTTTKPLTESQRLKHNEAQRKWRRKVKRKTKNDKKRGRGRPACNYTVEEKHAFKRVKERHNLQIKRLKTKLKTKDLSLSDKEQVTENIAEREEIVKKAIADWKAKYCVPESPYAQNSVTSREEVKERSESVPKSSDSGGSDNENEFVDSISGMGQDNVSSSEEVKERSSDIGSSDDENEFHDSNSFKSNNEESKAYACINNSSDDFESDSDGIHGCKYGINSTCLNDSDEEDNGHTFAQTQPVFNRLKRGTKTTGLFDSDNEDRQKRCTQPIGLYSDSDDSDDEENGDMSTSDDEDRQERGTKTTGLSSDSDDSDDEANGDMSTSDDEDRQKRGSKTIADWLDQNTRPIVGEEVSKPSLTKSTCMFKTMYCHLIHPDDGEESAEEDSFTPLLFPAIEDIWYTDERCNCLYALQLHFLDLVTDEQRIPHFNVCEWRKRHWKKIFRALHPDNARRVYPKVKDVSDLEFSVDILIDTFTVIFQALKTDCWDRIYFHDDDYVLDSLDRNVLTGLEPTYYIETQRYLAYVEEKKQLKVWNESFAIVKNSENEIISISSDDVTSNKADLPTDDVYIDLNLADGDYPPEITGIEAGRLVYARHQKNPRGVFVDTEMYHGAYLIQVKLVGTDVVQGLVQWQEFTKKEDQFAYVPWEHITDSNELGKGKRIVRKPDYFTPNITPDEEFAKIKRGRGEDNRLVNLLDKFAKGKVTSAVEAFKKIDDGKDDYHFLQTILCTCMASIDVTFLVFRNNPNIFEWVPKKNTKVST